jgi:hypothetical protein
MVLRIEAMAQSRCKPAGTSGRESGMIYFQRRQQGAPSYKVAKELGVRLDHGRASFEASLREAPQDEVFLNAIKDPPHRQSSWLLSVLCSIESRMDAGEQVALVEWFG